MGYKAGMIGKWHLGAKAPHLPISYGFDSYFGLPHSNDMWPVDYDGTPATNSKQAQHKYPPLPLLDGTEPVRYIETLEGEGELTSLYTEKAIQFIEKNKKKPFFLYLAPSMVHVSIYASSRFLGKSGKGLFADVKGFDLGGRCPRTGYLSLERNDSSRYSDEQYGFNN